MGYDKNGGLIVEIFVHSDVLVEVDTKSYKYKYVAIRNA